MRTLFVGGLGLLSVLICAGHARGQSLPSTSVPRLINVSGVFQPANGQPPEAGTVVTLSIYTDPVGGALLWQETQTVTVDTAGRFALLLGATQPEGIPLELFASGEARWLGMQFAGVGEVERPRRQITSVPYALQAADAATLGGRPASAYMLAPSSAQGEGRSVASGGTTSTSASPSAGADAANDVLPGTISSLAKYVSSTNVGSSAVFENNGMVGIGTGTPGDVLHVRFTNTAGSLTGLALQNLGNTATSYSGTLFYDQNGALGQFQGFNNVTHEYRINNIATSGSINFMLGSTSRLFVGSSGVGIGTSAPGAGLDVSNAISGAGVGTVLASTFTGTQSAGSLLMGRRARGTAAAPTAVLSGDTLAGFWAQGYGATGFSGPRAGFFALTSENWTDTAQGAALIFATTPSGENVPRARMAINNAGFIGIGTLAPENIVEVARENGTANVITTSYNGQGSGFRARAARGTLEAPAATQVGDELAEFTAGGYTGSVFTQTAGMEVFAAENWTNVAQGSAFAMYTTPISTNVPQLGLGILPNGNVGIGTPKDVNGLPTATDKVQVFGDIRVGNATTNGCLKNFAGTGLVGTCVSDRRFKRDITPFGSVLNRFAALQPVRYYWRAADYPDQHFGDAQAYGLIAQDVEQVLPELVVTRPDGYKAVDYSELPMLTIQAVKELKAENDELKRRLADVERLLEDLAAKSDRR